MKTINKMRSLLYNITLSVDKAYLLRYNYKK